MSSVDERIVKMVFDNAEFAVKVASTITSLTNLNKATDQVANSSALTTMGRAFEQAEVMATRAGFHISDVWQKVSNILEYQVAGKIVNVGKNIANALSFQGISDGLKEYETQLDSVQTIMANTGLEGSEGLAKVNATLDELNEYADKTIYNFTQMTRNIGTFTAAGLDLDTSAKAIQGIANLAAVSGSTSQQASTAMYQLSQALASGTVKLQDWNSVVNAGMGGKVFQNALIQTAATMSGMGDKVDEWKKKNVDAFGSFRESLTKGAWLTTDVLSQTLNQFTMAAEKNSDEWKKFKKELMNMGYTEQAAEDILKMANTATEAATKVKTFTQLIDTLKEAIGSGWAQSWRILIGDFEEAKQLWTSVSNVLGGFIDKSSEARNNMLKNWKALGGRQQIIDSLTNAFNYFTEIIKPIGWAMREIFPPVTAKNLLYITSNLKKFTEQLSANTAVTTRIQSIARGFFSIFDIGLKLVKAFVKAILPAGKGIGSLGWNIFDAAAKFGDFIYNLDKTITESKIFEQVFQGIANVIKPIFEFILSGAKGAVKFLGDFFGSFSKATTPVKGAGDALKRVFDNISNGVDNIKKKFEALKPIFEGLSSIFKGVGKILGTVFKQIGDSLSGFASNGGGSMGIINIINSLISGGILYKLFTGIKSFSSIGESFGGVLDGLSNALNNFGEKVGSETLLNAAKAVGILAVSLLVVASIDSDKLTGATTAISVMMGALAGAIYVLMKAIDSFDPNKVKSSFKLFGKELFSSTKAIEMAVTLQAVSKALISMGAAILMMSVGLKIVSTAAENGHLWDSFAVISLMLAELTGVAIVLGKWGNQSKKGAQGLISMTVSLIVMAEALKMVSQVVEGGNAWESLAIVGLMVAGLTGIMIAIDKLTKYKALSMAPLISMAISVNLLVFALKSISDALGTEGNHIWEALGVVGLMVAGLAAVSVVLSKFAGFSALGGLGAILAATSILILVQALKQISDALGKTDQHIWQALGVIGASLAVLAVGLTLMSATIPGAVGLLVASAALVVLGGALKIISSIEPKALGKALIALAGSLLGLAVGLTAMILALPGAIALTVAAFGLTVLAGALKLFGSMSLGEIIKSLGTLVVALSGIAIISTVLSVASPFILAFSVAILAFGAALTVTAMGMTLFATGLQALVAVLPMGTVAIDMLARSLLALLPVIVEQLMNAFGVLAEKIIEFAPTIGAATLVLLTEILNVLAGASVKFGETTLQIITGILQVLTENIPLLAQAGADLMIAYLEAISTEIPRVVDAGYQCAIALVNGLADAIESNNGELIEAVDHLMSAVIQAIAQWIVEFTPFGLMIPEELKEGIMSGEFNVKDAIDNLIKAAVEAVRGFFENFREAAEYLIGGLIEGLKGTAVGKVVTAAAELGGKIIDGLNSKKGLDEHSNSKRGIKSGEYLVGGVIEGIENGTPDAVEASTEMGDKVAEAINDPLKGGVVDATKILDEYSDIIDNEAVESLKNLTDITKLSKDATNEHQESVKESTKAVEKHTDAVSKQAKIIEDLGTETARQNKIVEKNTVTYEYNTKAMKNNHDKALTLHEAREHSNNGIISYNKNTKDNTKAVEENTKAQEANAKATGKAGKATKTSADVMEYASDVVEAFNKKYGKLYEVLGEDAPMKVATFAVKTLAEETYKASLKAEEATEKNKKTKASIEDMIKAFTDMKKKIVDSVKSYFEGDQFFQKFEMKTEMSMKTLLENMKSNLDGISSWAANLDKLGEMGVNQGLLKHLAELGPKGYEYVNAFANATTEEIQSANQMFEQAALLPDSTSNNILATYAKAGLNVIEGFANGINENTQMAVDAITNANTTTDNELSAFWEIKSPSRRMYRYGDFMVQGLNNGIRNNVFLPINTSIVMCERISNVIEEALNKDKFYRIGLNIALGLAEGMASEAALMAVSSAAETLSAAAEGATLSYNEMNSPSKLYKRYGDYIAQGLAQGMVGGTSYVAHGATILSEAIQRTLDVVDSIAERDMEIHPVISPVLDLSSMRSKANSIGSLFPGQSIALASSIGIGSNRNTSSDSSDNTNAPASINFTQNNYSPKALSRYEIYRQTKNQLSTIRKVVTAQ